MRYIAIAAVLSAISLSSAATATDGLIHGCVNDHSGKLRIVAEPSECRLKETPLSWAPAGAAMCSLRVFDGAGNILGIPWDNGFVESLCRLRRQTRCGPATDCSEAAM